MAAAPLSIPCDERNNNGNVRKKPGEGERERNNIKSFAHHALGDETKQAILHNHFVFIILLLVLCCCFLVLRFTFCCCRFFIVHVLCVHYVQKCATPKNKAINYKFYLTSKIYIFAFDEKRQSLFIYCSAIAVCIEPFFSLSPSLVYLRNECRNNVHLHPCTIGERNIGNRSVYFGHGKFFVPIV